MEYKFVIKGRLPSLNEYIEANRRSPYQGNQMKRKNETIIIRNIKQQLDVTCITKPVFLLFRWFEKNKRRDHDNVSSFGRKVIQDALVKANILQDDGWGYVIGFQDEFFVDFKEPRIEIIIKEIG